MKFRTGFFWHPRKIPKRRMCIEYVASEQLVTAEKATHFCLAEVIECDATAAKRFKDFCKGRVL